MNEMRKNTGFRFTLSVKLALMVVATVLIVAGAQLSISLYVASVDAEANIKEAVERNMGVAWNELQKEGKTYSLENGQLMADAVVLNGKNELADRIVKLVGGNATIFMGDTRVATNVKKEDGTRATGTQLARNEAYEAVFAGKNYRGKVDILGQGYITGYDPIKDSSGKVIGILFVGIPLDHFYEAMNDTIYYSVAGSSVVGLLIILLALWTVRTVVASRITRMKEAMEGLAEGNLEVAIPVSKSNDEIADMGMALQVFKENARQVERMRAQQKEAEALAAEERRRALHQMADNFESEVMGVVQVVSSSATEMHSLLEDMSRRSGEVNTRMASVAAATDETSSNVHTVAAASEELSSSIGEIGRQVTEAAKVARQASEETARTDTTVKELAASAEKIGEVVNLIAEIASQTNLLALNATIEAARAGEAGKGFAVVASEVKNLATQTAKATGDISAQIAAVQDQTHKAVEAIQSIGGVIEQVKEISSNIASAIEEQGAATREISHNVQQAAQGTQEVSSNIGGVSHVVQENVEAEKQMVSASDELAQNAEKLRGKVVEFLTTVRS